jgi:hypothetical protein
MNHKMHVENHPCECGANDCHGHTVHHLHCSCGLHESAPYYGFIALAVRDHCPDWKTYQVAMRDTQYPRSGSGGVVGSDLGSDLGYE